jgi:hypothetical protein
MIVQGSASRDPVSWVRGVLSREFADRLDAETIGRVAAEEVEALNGSRIRDFIPILAMRRARLRLREWAHGRPEGGP